MSKAVGSQYYTRKRNGNASYNIQTNVTTDLQIIYTTTLTVLNYYNIPIINRNRKSEYV